jgi:hypothetical protein
MWGKPTIEMRMDHEPRLGWPEREAGSDIATSADELTALVDRYAAGASVEQSKCAYRRDYIQRWFGALDGRRCADAADAIDGLLRVRGRRRHYFTPFNGLRTSPRQVVSAVARYALGMRPNESLVRRTSAKTIDPQDKQIRRIDVRAYSRLIAGALG